MRWFRFYSEALDDPKVQRLPPVLFRTRFLAAVAGEQNEFSRFIAPGFDRPHPVEWNRLRSRVFQRDNYTCRYCGAYGAQLECDHVIPVSRGGSNALDNLVTACRACNRAKAGKLLEEWQA